MEFAIREMTEGDRAVWADMRAALWPEERLDEHAAWIAEILKSCCAWGFIAETPAGAPAGILELAARDYANGCESRPVAFLEGIWVCPQ